MDWLRNIRAAGRCRMRHRDSLLELGAPRTLSPAEGIARMPQPPRTILRGPVTVADFVELPILSEWVRPARGR